MDEGDYGKKADDDFTQFSIRAVQSRIPEGPGTIFCVDCDEEIPGGRREKMPGCTRCVECQTRFERNGGR